MVGVKIHIDQAQSWFMMELSSKLSNYDHDLFTYIGHFRRPTACTNGIRVGFLLSHSHSTIWLQLQCVA